MEGKLNSCFPLKSYDDVLNWKCEDKCWAEGVRKINNRTKYCYSNYGRDQCTQSNTSIRPSLKLRADDVPKTLICHDMKGGYLEDRFVHDIEANNPYRFYHWSCIDLFVYFSHFFVTIPPVGWINAGHLHGVPVLGTLITESNPGIQICESILASKERIHVFTRKLAEICEHYGFDGYLVNIENRIDADLMNDLVYFVKTLREELTAMCVGRDTFVIWYDSVIVPSGKLKWQNKLNEQNKKFFDVCDGIFLNYCWKESDLKESVENAAARLRDVYVGVDVFGRGCYGGGGFSSDKALEVIRSFGLSAAIFGPGWTHELQSKKEGDDFVNREVVFWKKLQSFVYMYGPSTLPFRTTFCQGYGQRKYKEGDVCSEVPWFNLNKQNYQPTCCSCMHSFDAVSCISVYTDEVYEGGSCLKLFSCSQVNNTNRLLACNFDGKVGDSFYITIAFKFLQDDGQFNLILLAEEKDTLEFVDIGNSKTSVQISDDRITLSVSSFKSSGPITLDLESILNRSKNYPNGWHKRTFKLTHTGDVSLREVCVEILHDSAILLGLFEVITGK